MRWAQRLKRVFQIDVETCPKCGGTVQIIASIEGPPMIERILTHLASKDLPGLVAGKPGASGPAGRLASLNRRESISGRVPSVRSPAALVLDRPARQKRGHVGCLIAADRAETDGIRRVRGFGKGLGPV